MVNKVEADSPNRCQGVSRNGQCYNEKENNSDFCRYCSPPDNTDHTRNYRLTKFRAKLEHHIESPNIKGLREEVGILRLLVEETVNKCDSEADLLLKSQVISDLVMKLEKLVTSCHKLEYSLGDLLSKTTLQSYALKIINLVDRNFGDHPNLHNFINDMQNILGEEDEIDQPHS